VISIRLSEREYAATRAMYTSFGARNVSDFVRIVVQRAITGSVVSDPAVATVIREFDLRLNLLEQRVSTLAGQNHSDNRTDPRSLT